MTAPDPESVRAAMDQAWRDHHHTRDQTWRSLQIVALFAAGLVGVDASFEGLLPTLAAAALTVIAALFGIAITRRHRDVEVQKFKHILRCEGTLGLDQLIDDVSLPSVVGYLDIVRFWKSNSSIFIMRMHAAVLTFAVIFAAARVAGVRGG